MSMSDAANEFELANLDDRAAVKYPFLNLLGRPWFSRKWWSRSSPGDSYIKCGHDSALFSELKIFWEVVKRNVEGQPWPQWDQPYIDNIFSVTVWAQSRHSQSRNITKRRTPANDLLVLFKSFTKSYDSQHQNVRNVRTLANNLLLLLQKQAPLTRQFLMTMSIRF
jgi:hypothetical protein